MKVNKFYIDFSDQLVNDLHEMMITCLDQFGRSDGSETNLIGKG